MACQALGRCRICAKKHKIAVFGGEKAQHFFIEKAKLKLIILNTVCIDCIGKIERFVKKMDLDMVFNDYIKEERLEVESSTNSTDSDNSMDENARESENRKTIRIEGLNEKAHNSPVAMNVDQPIVRSKEKCRKAETSVATKRNGCTSVYSDVEKKTNAQARPLCTGDSQSVASPLRRSPENQIGQKTSETSELANEPRRKHPKIVPETHPAMEDLGRNTPSIATTSAPTVAFVDCHQIDCASTSKKLGRFLWCDFCKKEFTHAGDLNKHRRKHTGEKPYECIQCQRKFAHASNLARHQRVHSGERPFSCTKCDRTFTRKDKLTIHTTTGKCQINTTDK